MNIRKLFSVSKPKLFVIFALPSILVAGCNATPPPTYNEARNKKYIEKVSMAYGSVKAGEQRIEEQMNELMDSPSMHKDQSWQDRARVTSGVLLVPNILLDEVEAAGVPLEHRQFHDDFKILSKKSEKCSKMFTMLTIAFIKAPTNWISPISDEFIISRMDLKNAREEIRPRLVELREKYCIVQPTL